MLNFARLYSSVIIPTIHKQPKLLTIKRTNNQRFYANVAIPGTPKVPKEFTREQVISVKNNYYVFEISFKINLRQKSVL